MNPHQAYFAALFQKYVSSTDTVFSLSYKSSRSTYVGARKKHVKLCQNSSKNIQAKQDLSDLSTSENQIDSMTNISIIKTDPNESICKSIKRTSAEQSLLVCALEEFGFQDYFQISTRCGIPISSVFVQVYDLFYRIDQVTVSNEQWKELCTFVNQSELHVSKYYEATSFTIQDITQVIETFKAAFIQTFSTLFSLLYCCEKYGVKKILIITIIRQFMNNQ
ncbi:Hypothetical_protein [Hexamita inflata]|uniref:Hypothetical_protein n=1 Tax=Hexamita inflata TaxID=28002 RepID=A0AA86UDN2_9EUKA|nr:Hypothetical protein HINF_LOCUS35521 [Hexamita inflata]